MGLWGLAHLKNTFKDDIFDAKLCESLNLQLRFRNHLPSPIVFTFFSKIWFLNCFIAPAFVRSKVRSISVPWLILKPDDWRTEWLSIATSKQNKDTITTRSHDDFEKNIWICLGRFLKRALSRKFGVTRSGDLLDFG